jgi:osmotically-inducible protein OsmY
MKNKMLKHFYRPLLLLLLSLHIIACGGGNHDAAIQTKISAITPGTPELENVSATVLKGVVTLVGQCKNDKDRERAEKAIKKIDDVKEVINNITVTPDIIVTSDKELKEQTSKVVKKYKHVRADVNEGVITLRGEVDKNDLQQLISDLNSLRPRRVENQLVVE